MKKKAWPILIGLLITLIFSAAAIFKFLPLERLELLLYDLRYQVRGKTAAAQEVVIATIDDHSLEAVGRWPWDRSVIARCIDTLKDMGAKVIVMDIIFSEPSKDDEILRRSIKRAGNVILPVVFGFKRDKDVQDDALFDSAIPMIRNSENAELFNPVTASEALTPLPELSGAASSIGHINMIADRDGVLRWEIMAIQYKGELYPCVSIQAVRTFLEMPMEALSLTMAEGVRISDHWIPTDFWNRSLIHYYGPDQTFPHVPLCDVLAGKADPDAIRDKIVLIGATAIGIYDLRVTPASPAMPGVEKHANVIASILHQDFISRTKNITNVLLILVTGIVFSMLMIKARAVLGALLSLFFVSAIMFSGYYLFFHYGLWMDMSYSSLNIVNIYLAITAYRYATEERYSKQIRDMFSSYVTERVVNELIKNPELAKLGGERREITVLFSDIRGFTTFSERHTPEQVVTQLNEYLSAMSEIVFRWEGTLDKYIGDAIVAFWGAPIEQPNHVELAIKCALNMIGKVHELQEKWIAEGKEPLMCGIGINTGDVVVGNIGAEGKKMDYTVIGDHVNLGARVESLTKKYGADILITEYTLEKIRSQIETDKFYRLSVKGVDKVIVKGKERGVTLYEIKSVEKGVASSVTELQFKEARRMEEK